MVGVGDSHVPHMSYVRNGTKNYCIGSGAVDGYGPTTVIARFGATKVQITECQMQLWQ